MIVDTCLSCEDIARQNCAMVPRLRFFGDFWVMHFQRVARSTFQTCIVNSHWGHTMCRSMVDIQSATAEIRPGKKIEGEEDRTRMRANAQRDGRLPNTGGALCSTPQSLADAHY